MFTPKHLKDGRIGEKLQPLKDGPKPRDRGYFWAKENLSFEDACRHFVTVGATGSGKSITLNLLMQSVFCKFGTDTTKRRALVYDSKSDLVSIVQGMLPATHRDILRILNPLDKRFSPWNIAADVTTGTDAFEFAELLLPRRDGESSPYFSDAARSLVAGVIQRFIATAKRTPQGHPDWTLRDLLLAFDSKERLRAVLTHDRTRYLLDHFDAANDRNFAGVKSTADTTLAIYRPIAELFQSAKAKPLSLKQWVNGGEGVLVFGNSEAAREATDTLNRLMFRQLSKFLIGREGRVENDETWIFLDELREAGKLSGLRQLLLRGRSKGVAVAMGFQDVEGIYAAYGDHEGAEIIGAAQNAAVMRINSTAPNTAEWASKVFGSRRDVAESASQSFGDKNSHGTGHQLELIPNVFPIQFCELPMPSTASHGMEFFSSTNEVRAGHGGYTWRFLADDGPLMLPEKNWPDFQAHVGEVEGLRLWEKRDIDRLNLSLAVLAEPKQPVNTLARVAPKTSTG